MAPKQVWMQLDSSPNRNIPHMEKVILKQRREQCKMMQKINAAGVGRHMEIHPNLVLCALLSARNVREKGILQLCVKLT